MWLTAPGWSSVLTGVDNNKHGVVNNDLEFKHAFTTTSQQYPTFLKHAHDYNYTTAAAGTPDILSSHVWPAYTPQWFLNVIGSDNKKPGILDYECSTEPDMRATEQCNLHYRKGHVWWDAARDVSTTQFAVDKIIGDGGDCADVILAHYDKIDHAGHQHGFDDNAYYRDAMHVWDTQFGSILDSLERASNERDESWLIVLTSDHGGRGTGHGYTLFHDQVIPFTVAVVQPANTQRERVELKPLSQPIRHYDTAPTVLHWLGIQTESEHDGQVQAIPVYRTNDAV